MALPVVVTLLLRKNKMQCECLPTGCEELYFHWNNRKSTLKGLPILIVYFPQKYFGGYLEYTTSLFYFIYT
jgi:hypothetical protein